MGLLCWPIDLGESLPQVLKKILTSRILLPVGPLIIVFPGMESREWLSNRSNALAGSNPSD